MRVILKAEVLGERWTGVQFYIVRLVDALVRRGDVDLVLHVRSEAIARRLREAVGADLPCVVTRGGLRDFVTPRADLTQADVIHLPTMIVPFRRKPAGPAVVMTAHDLIPLAAPTLHTRAYRVYFRCFLPRLLPMVDRYVAVSQSTRRDLIHWLKAPADRVTVTPLAPRFSPGAEGVPARGASPPRERFVLAVGTLEKRKNVIAAIRAFLELTEREPALAGELRIVGQPGWASRPERELIERHAGRIRWLGYVDDASLADLYRRAALLCYPSLYEGFGLPALEAMAMGCPIVVSDRASLPEVVGDAGLVADPDQPGALADAMRRILADPALAADLSERGRTRAAEFSWDRCAQQTVDAYHAAISDQPGIRSA